LPKAFLKRSEFFSKSLWSDSPGGTTIVSAWPILFHQELSAVWHEPWLFMSFSLCRIDYPPDITLLRTFMLAAFAFVFMALPSSLLSGCLF
jgi:hypothetical protein